MLKNAATWGTAVVILGLVSVVAWNLWSAPRADFSQAVQRSHERVEEVPHDTAELGGVPTSDVGSERLEPVVETGETVEAPAADLAPALVIEVRGLCLTCEAIVWVYDEEGVPVRDGAGRQCGATVSALDPVASFRGIEVETPLKLSVRADGYGIEWRRDLAPDSSVEVVLVPLRPLRVEFPRLTPDAGHFRAVFRGAWDPSESVDVWLDASGVAVMPAGVETGTCQVQIYAEPILAHDSTPQLLMTGSIDFDADVRTFRYEEVSAHRVAFLPPEEAETFTLSFLLRPPDGVELPRGGGWSGGYGIYGRIELESDSLGQLELSLLAGQVYDVTMTGSVSGEIELEPFEILSSGSIALTPASD